MANRVYSFIDLFAGCGGLSEGFYRQGFRALAHVEIDHYACETLRARMRHYGYRNVDEAVLEHDITSEDIIERIENATHGRRVDVIIGGPPCQAYSTAGRVRDGEGMAKDPRNYLFESYVRILEHFEPMFFVFENVTGLLSARVDGGLIFAKVVRALGNRYKVIEDPAILVHNTANYGVPQIRKRVIIMGVRDDIDEKESIDLYNAVRKTHYDPDMPAEQRQGYKTDDPRYEAVMRYVREELLPSILDKRVKYTDEANKRKKLKQISDLEKREERFKKAVVGFKTKTTNETAKAISKLAPDVSREEIKRIVAGAINSHIGRLGIKPTIDIQKKRILISHAGKDSSLGDVIYQMLLFNNIPPQDILFTSCENELSRIPEGKKVYEYLRTFFVDSYSDEKMFVIFVTSNNTPDSWGAMIEIGAAWITQIDNKIFNISPYRPEHPLDDEHLWHSTSRDKKTGQLSMDHLNWDIFCQKIEAICDELGYAKRTRADNKAYLSNLISVI